jgi:hypothetical protein
MGDSAVNKKNAATKSKSEFSCILANVQRDLRTLTAKKKNDEHLPGGMEGTCSATFTLLSNLGLAGNTQDISGTVTEVKQNCWWSELSCQQN